MFFQNNFTTSVDKPNFPEKLYTFAGIIEQNLEYTLNLISTLEDPAVKYKNEGSPAKLAKLETDIKNDILNYPPGEIVRIITFTTLMESVYNSINEIKGYIKELVKYPPIGFDLSEVAIKISGIAKKAIDGYFAGNIDSDLKAEIIETEKLINTALRQLHKPSAKRNRRKAG